MVLAQRQTGKAQFKQPCLKSFPRPAVGIFRIVEFDFLHPVNHLHGSVVLAGRDVETLIIQLSPVPEEDLYPQHIQHAANGKNQEDSYIVSQQDNGKNDQIDKTEKSVQGSPGQETLDAVVVAYSLDDIARMLAVEELHGKPQQLCPKPRQQRKVDSRTDIEQNPATDKLDHGLGKKQHQLSSQHNLNEIEVLSVDTRIDNALREVREYQLQQTADKNANKKLENERLVFTQVVE